MAHMQALNIAGVGPEGKGTKKARSWWSGGLREPSFGRSGLKGFRV